MPSRRSSKGKSASHRVSPSSDGTHGASSISGPERVTVQAPSVATPASDAVTVEEDEGDERVLISSTPPRSPLPYQTRRAHPGIHPPRGPVMPAQTAAPTVPPPGPTFQMPMYQFAPSQHSFMGPFFMPTNFVGQPQPDPVFMAQYNNSAVFGPSATTAPTAASNGQSYVFTGPGQPSFATAPPPAPYTQAPAVAQCAVHRPRHQFFPLVDTTPLPGHDFVPSSEAIARANEMFEKGRFGTSIRHSVALMRELASAISLADFTQFGEAEISWVCTAAEAAVGLNRAFWNRASFASPECSCAERRESEEDNHQTSA